MKNALIATLYAAALLAQPVLADDAHHKKASMAEAEVRKVDKPAKKITLKHGPIQNLDMPGMTMVFTAKSKSLLANLKVGDKIKFAVVNEAGKFIVTDIQPGQ